MADLKHCDPRAVGGELEPAAAGLPHDVWIDLQPAKLVGGLAHRRAVNLLGAVEDSPD